MQVDERASPKVLQKQVEVEFNLKAKISRKKEITTAKMQVFI